MMWSNFFLQEENRRRGAAGRRRAHGQGRSGLTPEREGKVKLALLLAAVGATLAVLSVGTEFWVELNTYKANGSAVCEAPHQRAVPYLPDTTGHEANCTYFKFFTTGENARIFQRTTKKGENFSPPAGRQVGEMLTGVAGVRLRAVLSPAGLLLLVSLEVFRHSVRALLQRVSPEPPPAPRLTYEYSWSLGCGVGAGLILLLGAGCFLLLTLPSWPWGSLCPKRGHRAT
uniref:Voltage-dependent calcium channel gamma-6 subunit n=1 Tax=Gorilla gorilla gorilla TaxID=9595 RepID=G3RTQ0_GORGO